MKTTLSATVQRKKLSLSYTIENDGAGDVYLANGLQNWHHDPDGATVTHVAYVNHASGNRVVFLQGFVDAPPGIDALRPRAPTFTRVPSGSRFEGEILANLPLREWDAYQEPSRLLTWPVKVDIVELRIHVRLDPERIFEAGGDFVGVGGGTADIVTATTSLPEPVKLLRRVGDFRRFA